MKRLGENSLSYLIAQIASALVTKANENDLSAVAKSGDYNDLLNIPSSSSSLSQSVFFTQLPTEGWLLNTDTGLYDATISVSGMLDDYYPLVSVDKSNATADMIVLYEQAWSNVKNIATFDGSIIVSALSAIDIAVPIILSLNVINNSDITLNTNIAVAVTLKADAWSRNAPYTQTITIDGLLGDKFENPEIIPEYSEDNAEREAQEIAWNMVDQIVSVEGALVFTCVSKTPTIDIPLIVKVKR